MSNAFGGLLDWTKKALEIENWRGINDEKVLEEKIYKIYSNHTPFQDRDRLSPDERYRMYNDMKDAERNNSSVLEMYGQGYEDDTLRKTINDLKNPFAYFMERYDANRTTSESRLTLTIDSQKAGNIFKILAEYMSDSTNDNTKYINQLKVMSPKEQGIRTDSVVVYLNTIDVD